MSVLPKGTRRSVYMLMVLTGMNAAQALAGLSATDVEVVEGSGVPISSGLPESEDEQSPLSIVALLRGVSNVGTVKEGLDYSGSLG